MEGYYTVAQIADKVKHSNQAIYKLINNNKELLKVLTDNTIVVGKGRQYSNVVLNWIMEYYACTSDDEENNQEIEESETQADQIEMALLRQEVEHLKEKLAITERRLEESQAEKKEMRQENGALLLLLAQEKQEKQQLLLEAQEQKTIAIQEAEIEEEKDKPKEESKKPGFFARIFGNKGK